jgi:general secretion pathway protein M
MMPILHAVLPWWRERTGREQGLVIIAGVIAVSLIAWYGIAAPLRHAAAAAHTHRLEAMRQLKEVEFMAERMKSDNTAGVDFGQTVEQSASQNGLVVASQSRNGDEITVRFSAVNPAPLFAWIRILTAEYGIVVTNLTTTRVSGGLLEAEAVLAQGGS